MAVEDGRGVTGIMNLYAGQVLRVDLTGKKVTPQPLSPEFVAEYWGGWGLAGRYFWEEASPRETRFTREPDCDYDRPPLRNSCSPDFQAVPGIQVPSHRDHPGIECGRGFWPGNEICRV